MTLNFADATITNTKFFNNYAGLSSNLIKMIYSKSTLIACEISNHGNPLGLEEETTKDVASGMVNMNYQSKLAISKSKISFMYGRQAGLVNMSGNS